MNISRYLISLYRQRFQNHQHYKTIISNDDLLIAIQLCLAQISKQDTGDFSADSGQVIDHCTYLQYGTIPSNCEKDLVNFQRVFDQFCLHCNVIPVYEVFNEVIKLYDDDKSEFVCQLKDVAPLDIKDDNGSFVYKLLNKIGLEIPTITDLDDSGFNSPSVEGALPSSPVTPVTILKLSNTEKYVLGIFCGYLELIVNTRNELALAKVLDVPFRGFEHAGFTALKQFAKGKGMPMYQVATSFVMQVQLGRKSTGPSSDNPLLPYSKSLSLFIHDLQNLQTTIEEIPDSFTAAKKAIIQVRKLLISGKIKLEHSVISKIASKLIKTLSEVADVANRFGGSPPKKMASGGEVAVQNMGNRTIRLVRTLLDWVAGGPSHCLSSTGVLSDTLSTQHTPVRLPCPLSLFRSPDVDNSVTPESGSSQEKLDATPKIKKKSNGVRSGFNWAPDVSELSCDDSLFVEMQHKFKEAENSSGFLPEDDSSQTSGLKPKSSFKRRALTEISGTNAKKVPAEDENEDDSLADKIVDPPSNPSPPQPEESEQPKNKLTLRKTKSAKTAKPKKEKPKKTPPASQPSILSFFGR